MMVPPFVRLGYPQPSGNHETRYVLLVRDIGWVIARFSMTAGYFYDIHTHPHNRADYIIDRDKILCWMPQDGS